MWTGIGYPCLLIIALDEDGHNLCLAGLHFTESAEDGQRLHLIELDEDGHNLSFGGVAYLQS